jgi:hypothetical protein
MKLISKAKAKASSAENTGRVVRLFRFLRLLADSAEDSEELKVLDARKGKIEVRIERLKGKVDFVGVLVGLAQKELDKTQPLEPVKAKADSSAIEEALESKDSKESAESN